VNETQNGLPRASWWTRWRRSSQQSSGRMSGAGEGPVTYVCVRAEDRWLITMCADRDEALAVTQKFHDLGAYVFAGQAARVEQGHWQLRQALRVFRGGGIGPLPWTGFPRSRSMGGEEINVAALRDSFERAVDADPELAHHYYQRLFEASPALRAYFPRTMAGQEAALGQKLVEIMGHLEDADHLTRHLAALGHRHATQYRVTPEMFGPVAEHLIATLEAAVGGWGDRAPELRAEWTAALGTVAKLMLAGFPTH
jgi:hemoglobin-like flavoprotein